MLQRLIRLHDLAHENVELAVALFANFGYFIRTCFVTAEDGALPRRRVTVGKFDNDARGRTKMKHAIGQAFSRTKHSAICVGKVDDELTAQIDPLASEPIVGDITKIACVDEAAQWHFASRLSSPVPAACRRSQCRACRGGLRG